MKEYVFYRWDGEGHQGALYFVVEAEMWENHIRNHADSRTRTELARGTEDEMNRLLKLIGDNE